jgi:hypothetical protein
MKVTFSASMILLVAATPAVARGSSPQPCSVRLVDHARIAPARATYAVACPGIAPTLLSVTYNSPSPSGASATTLQPRVQSARAPVR